MILAAVLLMIGLCLSAFFSGSETGFYRVTRVRLVIDAVEGDRISRGLLALTNFPALFVATSMVGNNLANYMTSLGVVLLTKALTHSHADAAELAATVMFSPLVFVYGELLPKYLFHNAPNLLLRRCAPAFLAFACLFAPISALLWLFGLLLQTLVGEMPLRVQPALARKELKEVLKEGHEAGILTPSQRQMAENVFEIGSQTIGNFCRPDTRIASVVEGTSREEILRLAKRQRQAFVAVRDRQTKAWVGYLRIAELLLSDVPVGERIRPLLKLHRGQSLIQSLIQLQSTKGDMAVVVDDHQRSIGLLYTSDMIERMVRNWSGRGAIPPLRQPARPMPNSAPPSGTPNP